MSTFHLQQQVVLPLIVCIRRQNDSLCVHTTKLIQHGWAHFVLFVFHTQMFPVKSRTDHYGPEVRSVVWEWVMEAPPHPHKLLNIWITDGLCFLCKQCTVAFSADEAILCSLSNVADIGGKQDLVLWTQQNWSDPNLWSHTSDPFSRLLISFWLLLSSHPSHQRLFITLRFKNNFTFRETICFLSELHEKIHSPAW